jgi:hypothetical protein
MSIPISYQSISQLAEIIRVLKPLGVSLDYAGNGIFSKTDMNQLSEDLINSANLKDVQYVLDDILHIDPDAIGLIASLHIMKDRKDTDIQRQNMKLLLSMLMDNDIDITEDDGDSFFEYYQKNPSPEITNLFIHNVTFFSPYDLERYDMFKVIVQHLDRDDFYAKVKSIDYEEEYEELYMKGYDTAAKKRAVDVSLGLGYAQMDNQVQSTIPTLVLQQIVNETADLSGMPAWQVYQIVKHINEGTTDKTIRLGVENKFADAKEEAIKIGRLGLPDDFQDAEE